MPNTSSPRDRGRAAEPDGRLLDAAMSLLAESGWAGLTQERMAERAGLSRVTAWRAGATKEAVVAALLHALERDFHESLWPVLTAEGSGLDRLREGLTRLCEVADRHLPLLLASDRVLHQAFRREHGGSGADFSAPFARFIGEGRRDDSLRVLAETVDDAADVVFNSVCWTYVHLRGVHLWPAAKARSLVLDLVEHGLACESAQVPPGG